MHVIDEKSATKEQKGQQSNIFHIRKFKITRSDLELQKSLHLL